MPITKIDRKVALFQEVDAHLLRNATPSVFLNSLKRKPEFSETPFNMLYRLQDTPQPPRHHPEGSVWNHTLMVVDEAAKVKDRSCDARVFMWAALLHDIGKPPTTKMRGGRVTSYDHDKAGAELAKEFLSTFSQDSEFISKVTALVRYHMHLLYVEKGLPYADLKGMKEKTDTSEVALLGLCDRLGRLGAEREKEEENVKGFLEKVSQ